MTRLFHFSEDPTIERFMPHVPATNPDQPRAVWAIDEAHAPLYWFPRDCPRVTAWPRNDNERSAFAAAFHTTAPRVHAIELGWLDAVRSVELYRYHFDPASFSSWAEATGQYTASQTVEPLLVEPVGDVFALHAEAGVELRLCPSLWPMHDLAVSDDAWDFSMVRMRNAQPRIG